MFNQVQYTPSVSQENNCDRSADIGIQQNQSPLTDQSSLKLYAIIFLFDSCTVQSPGVVSAFTDICFLGCDRRETLFEGTVVKAGGMTYCTEINELHAE